jgi:tetratricopeptide (TPR) repeat protein
MDSRLRRGKAKLVSKLLAAALAGVTFAGGNPYAATDTDTEGEALHSLPGSYLAGRFARSQMDSDRAASFYKSALRLDPGNDVLLEQAFLMEVTEGNFEPAQKLAADLVAKQPTHRLAHVFLGLVAFKAGDFAKAEENFKASNNGPIGELTSALARAWVKLAEGKPSEALAMLDIPKQAEWAQFYVAYHRALINDIAGRSTEARSAFEKVFKQDARTLRTTLAYAQSAAAFGDTKLAKNLLKEHLDRGQGDGHPLAKSLRDRIDGGERIPLLVPNATDGLAEVFYGLGEALTGEGGVSLGVLYLQLSLLLAPEQPFALAALASGYETAKKYESAIATYERIPLGSPLQQAIDIRMAFDLNSLDRQDDAIKLLERVIADDPTDLKPLDALGNILRARKRFAEAADVYTKAIALIPKPDKRHWVYFYSRGTCYERMKKWPQAEADLQKALALAPDQALVLNYLGYSWIDQNRNLKQGMQLIEKAVSLKPDDGYIVDSLGWAHYRTGNYKEAVKYLEKAVELKPEDPVLNDHLGDALWRVGRTREARFQWDQSLTLSPEPEDAERIKKKLVKGLPVMVQQVKKQREASTSASTVQKKRAEPKSGAPVLE